MIRTFSTRCNGVTTYRDNAIRLAANCTTGTFINACHNPEFAKIIKTRLIPYVVLWSGVMRSHFQIGKEIATSSSVETTSADLKNRAFKANESRQICLRTSRIS